MKLFIFSDLHAHNFREFSETLPGGMNSRLRDQLNVLTNIEDIVANDSYDHVWFLGDLLHLKNNPDTQVLDEVVNALQRISLHARLFLVAGNHDYRLWAADPAVLRMLSRGREDRISVITKPTTVTCDAYRAFVWPYMRAVKDMEHIIKGQNDAGADIFFGHQDLVGMRYGGITSQVGIRPEFLQEHFKASFVGHCHASQMIHAENGHSVVSVGSPLQLSFAEMYNVPTFWTYDTEEDGIQETLNNFSPKFKEIVIEDGADRLLHEQDPDGVNFYRVIVRAKQVPEWVGGLKWKRVVYEAQAEAKKRDRGDLKFADTLEQIVEKYVRLKAGPGLDEKRLVELGRKYLKFGG